MQDYISEVEKYYLAKIEKGKYVDEIFIYSHTTHIDIEGF